MADNKGFYSVSKVQTFARCTEMYHLHYTMSMYRSDTNIHTLIGTMVHSALEDFYEGKADHPHKSLQGAWSRFFEERDLGDVFGRINDLSTDLSQLAWRASTKCQDPKLQIRTKDGSIPKNASMTSIYKKEAEKLGLDERKAYIDRQVDKRTEDLKGISLVDCYAETNQLLENYEEIPGLTEVKNVELSFSEKVKDPDSNRWNGEIRNPVILPRTKDYLNGFADLVAVVNDQIAIIDHKTSSGEAPDVLTVMYWDQLLLYAFAYEAVFGEKPYYIGINHLRSGKTTLAPINWDIVKDAVNRFEDSITSAKSGNHCKRSPTEFGSPCLGGAKSMAEATRVCKYLDVCHPDLHKILRG